MKKLLLSTALVAVTTFPAIAADADSMFRTKADPQEIHASEFIGMRVYRAEAADAEEYSGVQNEWDDIGEIHDVILSRDGSVEAVLVDIGGFLGIGENRVAIDMESVRFVSDSATEEDDSDFFLVLNAPREDLEGAPAYEMPMVHGDKEASAAAAAETEAQEVTEEAEAAAESAAQEAGEMASEAEAAAEEAASEAAAGTEAAAEEVSQEAAEAEAEAEAGAEAAETEAMTDSEAADAMAPREPYTREGYVTAEETDLTAEMLTGAAAYDANDEWIGEVSELLLTDDGKVKSAIVDVGGFLGLGEKPVELDLSQIDILRAEDGSDVRVYISKTEEELKAMPDYEG